MITKKQQLIDFYNVGDFYNALRIAKDFRVDFDKNQQRMIQIAYESYDASKQKFYSQIGINVDEMKQNAQQLIVDFVSKKTNMLQ